MACTSQRRLLPSPRVLYLSLLIILASTCSSSATPTKPKSGLLDKIIYVSEDPAIQRWRSEISGAGIYPAHYALKAIDLLPTRNAPVRYMRARERRSRRSNIVIDDSLGLHKAVVHAPTRRGQIEARRRRKKGKGKDRDGHDEKGYDDGSWRGKNGDYGSVKKGGKDDTETEDYGQESEYEDEYQQGAPSKYSDDVRETDGEDLRDDEENGYSTAEEGSSSAFQPGKQKSKFKSDYEEDENAGMGISEDGWRAPGPSKSSTDPSESNIDNESKWKDNDVPRDKGYYGSESNRSGQDVDDGKTTYDGPRSTDCEALKTFYDDMGGHEWTDSTGWTSTGTSNSPSCCRAYGVSCNSVGRVTALDLGQNGLSGSLSLSIFELRYLSRL